MPTDKERAHRMVRDALKHGRLTRPAACTKCGEPERKARDGRSLLQGHHHHGYDHPLDVEWLCVQCHRDETPSNPPRGEVALAAKLTEQAVREIRESSESARSLGRKYGVHFTAISQIKLRKTWSHVE